MFAGGDWDAAAPGPRSATPPPPPAARLGRPRWEEGQFYISRYGRVYIV